MYPNKILHWIEGKETCAGGENFFIKKNPATGENLAEVVSGGTADVEAAISAAKSGYEIWRNFSVIKRADILRKAALILNEKKEAMADIVSKECGKSKRDALGEVGAAYECGMFFAGEGRRYFGKVLQSAVENRQVKMIRESMGIGAIFTPFNNPAASIAWKTFPALLCGNAIILKANQNTPCVAMAFAKIFQEAGLPNGVFNVLQGTGEKVGAILTNEQNIKFISFTGSPEVGGKIISVSAARLAKVSIEAGGKNPLVVCDDADLELAVSCAASAAFVDAGQRCAATSRIIIFDAVYEQFKKMFLERVATLKVGEEDGDNFGAIISEERMNVILAYINAAVLRGVKILFGGARMEDKKYKNGFFIAPTVLEGASFDDEISQKELFGPVVALYRVKDLKEAIEAANNSKLKLSGAIHTKSINRAEEFIKRYEAGVVRVNGPTHGSEPHMPFGGTGLSGNGWREPGETALDFYSDWKQISIDYNPGSV